MLVNSIVLAIASAIGFYTVYAKLPLWIKGFLMKHVLITDLVASLLTYSLFGGTVTALFAAAFLGIMVDLLLLLASTPDGQLILEKISLKITEIRNKTIKAIVNTVQ